MELVVVSDTHLRDGLRSRLSDAAMDAISSADVVLHAGDVMSIVALEELQATVPTYAVLGNNDAELAGVLPETLEIELAGVKIAMLHDSGSRQGRGERLTRRFPSAQLIVFGHSHIPWQECLPGGKMIFNPGSATERRSQPHRTIGRITIQDGEVASWGLQQV